ncbi:MAG: thiamine phosphate synthase [Chloroflexota bacterium]|nr:thiamine phosphate synthase [Chloroflexota bacterium]MDE2941511.1 thiamine phosphate synthase [Chloroflexota bacterium]MDE3267730.1 thiamine phosphate synthase [Chloroflexota bacterium]
MDRAARDETARKVSGLYVIVDAQAAGDRDLVELTQAALRGGARVIQLRDKLSDKGDVLPVARSIRDLCDRHDAVFIMNDHADLAVACDAHGLHLGQHDLPVAEARAILKPYQIIGTSNALVEEAAESERQGVDYLAVGAMFPTDTKERTRPAGLSTLSAVKATASAPVVAIGGINLGNISQVVSAGADAACVISAVVSAPDPEAAARELIAAMQPG